MHLLHIALLGSDAARVLQAVAEAVGAGFLARLLRGGGSGSGDAAARGDGGAALAAAVAAALCRAPALAAAPAFGAALVPPLLSLAARAGTADAAVADALDAAAAAAAASPAAREAALAAGGVAAAAAALTARRGGNAPPELAAPAAALLSALLTDDAAALATHAQAAAACLPALAAALAASPGHAVQFEALRAALLLLAPPSAAADAVHAALCAAGLVAVADSDDDDDVAVPDEAPWAEHLARGVAAMLAQARLPAPVRHAALRACAGAARLRGSAWLACAAGGALLTPLVEVAVVEATVAMHSLARPDGAAPGAADEAATLLGLCLAVFEAAVEALAAGAADDEDNESGPKNTPGSAATVTAALRSLGRLAAVLLDFLEDDAERCAEAQAEPGGAAMDADDDDSDEEASPSSRGALRLAALRALGCFLAEVPGAHRQRFLKLLRWALSLRSAASPGGALGFLLPALLQATDVASAAAAAGSDDFEAADAGVRDALAAADALVDAGGCASLAAFARAVAAEAAGEEGAALGEAALAAALGVMRNVLARGVLAPSADVDPDAAEAREAAEKAFPPALAACCAWARDAPPDGELAAALRDAGTPPASAARMLDWLETLPC